MPGPCWVDVTFLEDDLCEITALLPAGLAEQEGLERVLSEAMTLYRNDEVAWRRLQSQHDAEAEAARTELKRREAAALLVSMRARTVQSEVEMYELRERVRELQERHAGQRARAEVLQRSVVKLRRRVAQLEARLANASPRPGSSRSRPSLLEKFTDLWRKHDV
ncbi:MAG: hypothetical protein QN183_11620 [Armatimonadota bacterium]|nr:hypothetical protein [Armatimonadota bacterium]